MSWTPSSQEIGSAMTLLQVRDLSVTIDTIDGPLEIIKGVDFSVAPGERLGIVGESGCGKSITALALMSLLPPNSKVGGQIRLGDENLIGMNARQLRTIRGNRITMIFQEPMTALNPVKTIGAQIAESLSLHLNLSRLAIRQEVANLMASVGLPMERFSANLYPHQLSGGQRQRVMIAMAIACKPDVLIADEPTTALDVTVQDQVLQLISDLVSKSGMALIMISHDLGVIAQTTEKVMVMYTGRIMEHGKTADVFGRMSHPYTVGLFAAIPKTGSSLIEGRKRLNSIPGQVPDPRMLIKGCAFADRCGFATDQCREQVPSRFEMAAEHQVWCFHPVSEQKRR